ncbi:MAG: pilus assembly protein PilM, partial [Victivallaceae bacterium]|nr:pilus assembly protein PilM [Victivallaceae bacterium]
MAHKKENTVLAIDIGGDSLKMAEYLVMDDGAGLELEKFDVREYPDELKELPLNEIFAETFSAMLEENDFISKSVVVSISGQVAFVRLSKLPRKIKDDKGNIQKIVELEAKQTIPYPMDEVIWDFQLVKYTVPGLREEKTEEEPEDEEDASQEPEFEDVDELESLIVAVKKDLITEIGELLEEHGKFIVSIEIASTAAYNAAKAVSIGDESCDMILNIGGRCSSLTIIDKSRIFTRVIPRAGFAVNQQICKEFNISVPEAEDLKRRHGFVALGGAYEEPDSEVAATIS